MKYFQNLVSYSLLSTAIIFTNTSCKKESVSIKSEVVGISSANEESDLLLLNSTGYLFTASPGTDVTNALQEAVNRYKIVYFDNEYIISNSIKIPSGHTLTGIGQATLKAAPARYGTLASRGIYIELVNKNYVKVSGITFQPDANMTNMAGWANTVILLSNSNNCTIDKNNFDFNFEYSKGMDAVWISGNYSRANIVSNNYVKTLGITYCEYGASSNTVEKNTLINSSGNALGGIGNGTQTCSYNKVQNNYIENAGRMGIEDQQNVSGTYIKGNVINGTGKLQGIGGGLGMGISAVAMNTWVEANKVTDAKSYYIEVGGRNSINVVNNQITDNGTERGIFVNFLATPKSTAAQTTIIKGNTITGCLKAIETFGDNVAQFVTITSNTITDPVANGIDLNVSKSVGSTITINQNNFVFTKKTNQSRFGIGTFSYTPSGSQKGKYIIDRNTFTYKPTVSGGTGYDITVVAALDNMTICNNNIFGYKGGFNYGITNNGATTKNVIFQNNNVTDAIWQVAQFLN